MLDDFYRTDRNPSHFTIFKLNFFPLFHAIVLNTNLTTFMDNKQTSAFFTGGTSNCYAWRKHYGIASMVNFSLLFKSE